jgi:hypothetical protein
LEGIMLANIQSSPSDMLSGKEKKVQSRISFDDGATWASLTKVKNEDGNDMKCDNVSKLKGKHFVFNLGHAH